MKLNHSLKIVLASRAPFLGGAEVAAERLALGLKRAGHKVVSLLGQAGAVRDRFESAGLTSRVVPMPFTDKWRWLHYRGCRSAIERLLKAEQPDLVHSNDLPTHQIMSDAARRLSIPRLCHHRFLFPGPCLDWLNKFGADRHLMVSRSLESQLTLQSRQISREGSAVVYDGVPLPEQVRQGAPRSTKADLGLPPDRLIVLFAGQIIERKGVRDLLTAWSMLKPAIRAFAQLVLIGDDLAEGGAYRRQMESLADQLQVSAMFLGFQKQVQPWLLVADIVVVPSLEEPLGNAVLEAMACGKPVIGSRVGGIPEMVNDHETGLLVPPQNPEGLAQAIEQLLDDHDLRLRLGQEARRRCEERFMLDHHAQAIIEQYRIILDRHRAKASA